ncbi:hypothetical protein [Streptomyces sp. NPDC017991]|uniref:hypothetical protein n=1 Tax=Streptomyces sp. NPDC017991 TaxID=3365026 RepID=UPI003787294F
MNVVDAVAVRHLGVPAVRTVGVPVGGVFVMKVVAMVLARLRGAECDVGRAGHTNRDVFARNGT